MTEGRLSIDTCARAAGGAALTLRAFSLAGLPVDEGGGGAGSGPGATSRIAPRGGGAGGAETGPEDTGSIEIGDDGDIRPASPAEGIGAAEGDDAPMRTVSSARPSGDRTGRLARVAGSVRAGL